MTYEEQQSAIIEGLARGIAWRSRADEVHLGPVLTSSALMERWKLSRVDWQLVMIGAAARCGVRRAIG